MKKALAICFALILAASMSFSVFAAPGKFVSSPSGTPAPELTEVKNETAGCTAVVVLDPYSQRNLLPADQRLKMETAYDQIVTATNLTDLNAGLAPIAEQKNVATADLAVSDLFDLRYTNCPDHTQHGSSEIALKIDAPANFVALIQLKGDTWEVVENAVVTEENGELRFRLAVDGFYPLAVVVNAAGGDTPPTGDDSRIPLYAALMAVSAAALVIVLVFSKKKSKKKGV